MSSWVEAVKNIEAPVEGEIMDEITAQFATLSKEELAGKAGSNGDGEDELERNQLI